MIQSGFNFLAMKLQKLIKILSILSIVMIGFALADDLGITLEQVAQWNVDKLQRRMQLNKIKGDGDNR